MWTDIVENLTLSLTSPTDFMLVFIVQGIVYFFLVIWLDQHRFSLKDKQSVHIDQMNNAA